MYDIPDFLRIPAEMKNHFAKGGMIKRADGSYSRRGLWDNIRANEGSGKKPSKQMLEQEARIKAKEYVVGGPITFSAGGEKHKVYEKESPTGNGKGVEGHIMVTHPTMDKGKWDTIDLTEIAGAHTVTQGVNATKKWHEENPEYGGGGYIVRRSHDRKGKTHVVIGPDGTKKYFGDANLGQHPHDAARKKAFYARHKHNLDNNPYFRAFARKTWEDGGEVPPYAYGGFYGRNDAAKMQRMFTPNADSMSPKFKLGGDNTEENDLTPLPTIMGNEKYATNNSNNKQKPAAYFNPNAMTTDNDEVYNPGTTNVNTSENINSGYPSGNINNIKADPFSNNLFGATSPMAQQTPNIQTTGLTNQPQYQVDPNQNTMPATTNAIAPDGNGNYNGNVPNSILSDDKGNFTGIVGSLSKEEQAKKDAAAEKEKLRKQNEKNQKIHTGITIANNTLNAGLYGADFISRALPQSFENAPLNFNRKIANDSTNNMNIVGNRKGIEYSAYGGVTGYKEGEELDLTAQQIYALEKQGYKFQTL